MLPARRKNFPSGGEFLSGCRSDKICRIMAKILLFTKKMLIFIKKYTKKTKIWKIIIGFCLNCLIFVKNYYTILLIKKRRE